jgi:hypothetical protein
MDYFSKVKINQQRTISKSFVVVLAQGKRSTFDDCDEYEG